MSVRAWRAVLLAFCAVCIAIDARSLFTNDIEASTALGFTVDRLPDPALVRISSVDPGGGAARSGLRVGDVIHLRALTPPERYRLLIGVFPGERIPVVLSRDGRVVSLVYRGGSPAWRWDIWLYCAASFWLLGFATLLAWRRADSAQARILCVVLALYVGASGLQPGSWLTPSPLADMVAGIFGNALAWVVGALFATYASLVARPLSATRRALTLATYAATAAVSLDEAVRLIQCWTGSVPWVGQSYGPDWSYPWGAIVYVLALLCAVAAIHDARGEERSRVAWTTGTLAILYVLQAVGDIIPAVVPGSRGSVLLVSYEIFNLSAFVAPIGMTYALLNRRILDIGFALNRAAIFSGVSLVLVGAFILVEWLLSDWLRQASHSANLAVAAALALLLGLSMRFVQTRVEHVVDNVFFRKRRQDEEAIRAMAAEAPYITERQVLLARTEAVLSEHADASFAGILVDDGSGTYGGIGENDPALVALRARHERVDLHAIRTAIEGEFAYPMVARGRLIGALVLGPKRSGEAYAPDESQAIQHLAHSVAGALEVLGMKEPARVDDLFEAIRALPDAIAAIIERSNRALEYPAPPGEV